MAKAKPHHVDALGPAEADGPETFIPGPVVVDDPPAFTQVDKQLLRRALAEIRARRNEALALYVPLPIIDRFHQDCRAEKLLRGSNRAGKTLGAAVEVARAVTGQDPVGKFPVSDGRAALVGLDGRHCGEVMYRKLFRPGAFKVIKDLVDGRLRAFSPRDDRGREAQAKAAAPLIPKRFIKSIAWEEKKRSIPSVIVLTNGWELTFYSSRGCPPNGIDIDLLWIDEEIENEAWWPEMVARLLDRKGKAFWSATPQVASEHLWNLHVRAEDDPEMVGEHVALLEDNPHIDEAEKAAFEKRLVTDEERRVRIRGEFAMTGYKVYPNFSLSIHGLDLDGPVPPDWARVLAIDPGRQVCAVLFAAIPPPGHPPAILLYDELYIKGCDAETFGKLVAGKIDAELPGLYLIDSHAGRVTEMGSGLTVESQYAAALARHGVADGKHPVTFTWGADDPKAGILAVHESMRVRSDGRTTLQVCRGRLPNFEYEVSRYHYRKVNKIISDEPDKKNDHLMDCLRYIVTARFQWTQPKKRKPTVNYAVAAVRKKLERKKAAGGTSSGGVRLGPGK